MDIPINLLANPMSAAITIKTILPTGPSKHYKSVGTPGLRNSGDKKFRASVPDLVHGRNWHYVEAEMRAEDHLTYSWTDSALDKAAKLLEVH